ncbi:MAG: AMP-binding protein, partial [Rhodospirillales bacterium]|nr:AMP-binding protein [Rhodospirillales bacterium]
MILGDIPRRNAHRFGEAIAFETQSTSLTWFAFNHRVNLLAHGLTGAGLVKSDRIAILSAPSIEVAEIYFAAAKLGLVIVPIHTGLVAAEIAYLLDLVDAKAILVEPDYIENVDGILDEITSMETRMVIGRHEGYGSYASLFKNGNTDEPEAEVSATDIYAIRFTSGTTGWPKGCPSTHQDWLWRSFTFMAHVAHSHGDRALLFTPLSVGVGSSLLMSYSLIGAHLHIQRRFDVPEILRVIEEQRINTFFLPAPNLFARLLDDSHVGEADLSSIRIIGYGGSVFPVPLMRRALDRFQCDFYGVYGHLEAGGFSTYLMPEDHYLDDWTGAEREMRLQRLHSCGREAMQADVRVVDEDGNFLLSGSSGEMIVRTEGMITQYWKNPEAIKDSLRNGWFHTGDVASIDEDGYIFISDRLKDVIKTGGMNVSSIEIENVLMEHEDVEESAAVGIPDPHWGEAIVVYVVRRGGEDIGEDALI